MHPVGIEGINGGAGAEDPVTPEINYQLLAASPRMYRLVALIHGLYQCHNGLTRDSMLPTATKRISADEYKTC